MVLEQMEMVPRMCKQWSSTLSFTKCNISGKISPGQVCKFIVARLCLPRKVSCLEIVRLLPDRLMFEHLLNPLIPILPFDSANYITDFGRSIDLPWTSFAGWWSRCNWTSPRVGIHQVALGITCPFIAQVQWCTYNMSQMSRNSKIYRSIVSFK